MIKIHKFLLCFCLIIFTTSTWSQPQPNNLWQTLDYYGFKTDAQKNALQQLLQKSGLDAQTLLHTDTPSVLPQILNLVKDTQDRFTLRAGDKERWQVTPAAWMGKDIANNAQQLTALGITEEVLPASIKSDVLCILGATRTRMQTRMDFAANLCATNLLMPKYLVMLAGERYITTDMNLDGTAQQLTSLAKTLNKPVAKLTETDLMNDIYKSSYLYDKIPATIIDTPKGDLPRPTTESTIKEFIKWLQKNPDVTRVTFVSNQPYIGYQTAVIAEVFKQNNIKIDFTVVGSGVDITTKPTLEGVVECAGALGSQIWAQTPEVIDQLGLKIDPTMKNNFTELYQKQPLVYQHVESLFES